MCWDPGLWGCDVLAGFHPRERLVIKLSWRLGDPKVTMRWPMPLVSATPLPLTQLSWGVFTIAKGSGELPFVIAAALPYPCDYQMLHQSPLLRQQGLPWVLQCPPRWHLFSCHGLLPWGQLTGWTSSSLCWSSSSSSKQPFSWFRALQDKIDAQGVPDNFS